jgi:FkbM family methyltransferase
VTVKTLLKKMKNKLSHYLKFFFRLFGIGITSWERLANLEKTSHDRSSSDLEFIKAVNSSNPKLLISLLGKSRSQLRQDLFVLSITNFKKSGYFVEFGATNGIELSNTYLLETEFSWKGILAEPAMVWREQLQRNRPDTSIETLCVWKDSSSSLVFNETNIPELSTINSFSGRDYHKNLRSKGKQYEVQTISLIDLLEKNKAPKNIDYLSIDTEGSEYAILNAFDFERYNFTIISVEHNYTSQRELIFALLVNKGYKRFNENISQFDDWYVKV